MIGAIFTKDEVLGAIIGSIAVHMMDLMRWLNGDSGMLLDDDEMLSHKTVDVGSRVTMD